MIFFIVAALILMTVYSVPGLYLARGMYASAVKEINSQPVSVVPPKPTRPQIKLDEMMHYTSPKRCNMLKSDRARDVCDCGNRADWIRLRNDWLEYNEWVKDYGHIKNGVSAMPKVNMKPIYAAVPGWPVVAAGMFIKGGAKNIPDYRAIERMEEELKELY